MTKLALLLTNSLDKSLYVGCTAYRDLIRQSPISVRPWGYYLGAHHLVSDEDGDSSTISDLDFGTMPDNWTPGAAYQAEHDYSVDEWRVDTKQFGATHSGDAAMRTVRRFYTSSRENGRFSGMSGTPLTFHGTGGVDGYAVFPADDSEFWTYCASKGQVNGGTLYKAIKVRTGVIEVYNGRKVDGGVKLREIAAGDEVIFSDDLTVIGSSIYDHYGIALYRKPGVLTEVERYRTFIKGSECTGFQFNVPNVMPVAATCAVEFNPHAAWSVVLPYGSASANFVQEKAMGTGTLFLTPQTVETDYYRALRFTGMRNDEKKYPSGGIKLSVTINDSEFYGTAAEYGSYTKGVIDDMRKAGLAGQRFMDESGANGVACIERYDDIVPAGKTGFHFCISPDDLAERAVLCGFKVVWINFPDVLSKVGIRNYLQRLDTVLPAGVRIAAAYSNEVWNFPNQSANLVRRSPIGDGGLEYADCLHEIIDAWEEVGSSRPFCIKLEWRTGNTGDALSQLGTRRYRAGTGPKLVERMAQHPGSDYAEGHYILGGQANHELTTALILGQVGTDGTVQQYYDFMINYARQARGAVAVQKAQSRDQIRTFCMSQGLPADAIGSSEYECSRHTAIYEIGLDGGYGGVEDLRTAHIMFEQSAELAAVLEQLWRGHLDGGGDVCAFSFPGARWFPGRGLDKIKDAWWGWLPWTGEGSVGPEGFASTSALYDAVKRVGLDFADGGAVAVPPAGSGSTWRLYELLA